MSRWADKIGTNGSQGGNSQGHSQGNSQGRGNQTTTHSNSQSLNGDHKKKSQVTKEESFNSTEILEYLHRNFQKHLANSNTLIDTVLYKSQEGNSQWKTKPPSKKINSKYNPRTVIRLDQKASLDLLFELNRSIYQQSKVEGNKNRT